MSVAQQVAVENKGSVMMDIALWEDAFHELSLFGDRDALRAHLDKAPDNAPSRALLAAFLEVANSRTERLSVSEIAYIMKCTPSMKHLVEPAIVDDEAAIYD